MPKPTAEHVAAMAQRVTISEFFPAKYLSECEKRLTKSVPELLHAQCLVSHSAGPSPQWPNSGLFVRVSGKECALVQL